MSKKESSSEAGDQAPDLSALDFGPAWARKDSQKKPQRTPQTKGRDSDRKQSSSRGRDNSRRDSNSHQDRQKKGGGFRGHGGGRGNDSRRGDRERKPMVAPPEGVTARIMPIEDGMDAMAKEISATGRTHSVFDLSWLVLGALDRFHVIFESEKESLYRSQSDHSVWISESECMAHFWSSGLVKKYYAEEITEVDPPAGNFQSVARCGFSGKLIGPPNHHAYQQTILNFHREKFSNMSVERYKSKITMEHGEEVVQEWLESMKKHVHWSPQIEPADDSKSEPEPEPTPAEDVERVQQSETPAEEVSADMTDSTNPTEPVVESTAVILDNRREVEQHFLSHGFAQEFENLKMASALANIPPSMINAGLMTLLKNTVAEEKRYPGNLSSILCRQMSGRHLAVYKWKKRLHCGPARPRHVSGDMVMADRPAKLFHWVIAQLGGKLDAMWKDCLPEGVDDDTRTLWYHDLHWLINEGLVLLFSDGTLHAAKELGKSPANQQTSKASKAKKKKPVKKEEEVNTQKSTEEKSTESPPQEN